MPALYLTFLHAKTPALFAVETYCSPSLPTSVAPGFSAAEIGGDGRFALSISFLVICLGAPSAPSADSAFFFLVFLGDSSASSAGAVYLASLFTFFFLVDESPPAAAGESDDLAFLSDGVVDLTFTWGSSLLVAFVEDFLAGAESDTNSGGGGGGEIGGGGGGGGKVRGGETVIH